MTFVHSIFGVLLPLLAVLIENATHACADAVLNPIPTPLHSLLILSLPLLHFLHLSGYRESEPMRFLSGFALAISASYTLLFVPAIPLAVVAIVWFGVGLLLLSPLLSFLATLDVYLALYGHRSQLAGVVCAVVLLFGATAPVLLTRHFVSSWDSEHIGVMRWLCHRPTLLRACYRWDGDGEGGKRARVIWYRIYGTRFEDEKPPTGLGRRDPRRPAGLHLSASRLEGSIAPEAGYGYCEWTLGLESTQQSPVEGRMRIQLPVGGVVSRATLWIDGDEREAAFAPQGQARRAYEAVVESRLDPLLVTTCGPDQVEVRCFPVESKRPMKFRLGMTFPLHMVRPDRCRFDAPRIMEHNLDSSSLARAQVWFESKGVLHSSWGDGHQIQGQLLSDVGGCFEVDRDASVTTVYCKLRQGAFLQAELKSRPELQKAAVVIDSSVRLAPWAAEIKAWLSAHPELPVFYAEDSGPRYSGGRDNVPALTKALQVADQVVWLAGPQLKFTSSEALQQRLERGHQRLWLVPLEEGNNELATELMRGRIQVVPPGRNLPERLEPLVREGWCWHYSEVLRPRGSESSERLARLWASQIDRLPSGQARERALLYSLVTPLTGAVVLENAQQYKDMGLRAPDDASPQLPSLPEPGCLALLAVGAAASRLAGRRRSS